MIATRIGAAAIAAAFALLLAAPAAAEWRAGNAEVTAAAQNPRIAAVLEAANRADAALIADDHAAFAALLDEDLVVNNPQNTVSKHGATLRLHAAGLISYSAYVRTIDYAGMRGPMVLLMGEERVTYKGASPMAGQEVRRRFTDLWARKHGRWVLTARQATIIPAQ